MGKIPLDASALCEDIYKIDIWPSHQPTRLLCTSIVHAKTGGGIGQKTRLLHTGIALGALYSSALSRHAPRQERGGGGVGESGGQVCRETDANVVAVVGHPVIDDASNLILVAAEVLRETVAV